MNEGDARTMVADLCERSPFRDAMRGGQKVGG